MSNYTGPFSFNLLASQKEIAVVHDGRVMLLKNPKISSMNIHYQADYDTIYTKSGVPKQQIQSTPKTMELELNIVATEWVSGDQKSIDLPQTVEDMTVEELLHAVNQKIDNREP